MFQISDNDTIAVIGLGYVGLSLAVEFGKNTQTIGFDIHAAHITELQAGHDRTLEVSAEQMQGATRLSYTSTLEDLTGCKVFIALINELALIFDRLDIDQLEVLEAAGTKWNFLGFRPGLVGAHCISVDPYYLTAYSGEADHLPIVLESCRHNKVEQLVYASTSSVYGNHTNMPFSVHESVDHSVSLQAATKKANELMAHTYSHLFQLPTTGLRFFTVYGPWCRPDMALFLFTRNILAGKSVNKFNYSKHKRDFTFVEDIVEGVIRSLDNVAASNEAWDGDKPDPATSSVPYRVYNIGNNKPIDLECYISTLESCLNRTAQKNLLPLQAGDLPDTYADVSDLIRDVNYKPDTSVQDGIGRFVEWYLNTTR